MSHYLFLILLLIQTGRISCRPESLKTICSKGENGGTLDLTQGTTNYLFHDKKEVFLDGNNLNGRPFKLICHTDGNSTVTVLDPNQLANNKNGFNKLKQTIKCPGVCDIGVVIIQAKADEQSCNFTDGINCDLKSLTSEVSRGFKFGPKIAIPSIEEEEYLAGRNINVSDGKPTTTRLNFTLVITYSIMDPVVGVWKKCNKTDEEGNVAKHGLVSQDSKNISNIDCPINDDDESERPAIIRVEKTQHRTPCVELPILCASTPEYSFISAKITEENISTWDKSISKRKRRKKKIMIGSLVGGLAAVILGLCGVLSYICWKKYKKGEQKAYHPTFYTGYPKNAFANSMVHTDSTHDGYVMTDFTTLDDYYSQDYWKANDNSEEAIKARKKIISRQLSGDPSKLNPTMTLNQQIKLLPYNDEHEIDRSKFSIGQLLGSGNFGSVYAGSAAGLFHPGSDTKVAIKTVNDAFDGLQITALISEIKVLGHLGLHLNLVNMLGSCKTNLEQDGQLWLLLEYCSEGDLKSFMIKHREEFNSSMTNKIQVNGLDERLFLKWGFHIAKGMEYLSSKRIMHGDLAARNILLGGMDGAQDGFVAKVSDFGLSKTFYEKDFRYKKEKRPYVPWKWMALEFLQDGCFTMSSDVWSFGVVIWEILSLGQEPYMGKEVESTVQEIKNGYRLPCPCQDNLDWGSDFYREITNLCWTADPQKRANFSTLVEIFEKHLTYDELHHHKDLEEQYGKIQTLLSDEDTRSKRISSYPLLQNLNQDPGYHKVFQNEANHNATGHDNLTPQPIANGYITVTQAIKA